MKEADIIKEFCNRMVAEVRQDIWTTKAGQLLANDCNDIALKNINAVIEAAVVLTIAKTRESVQSGMSA